MLLLSLEGDINLKKICSLEFASQIHYYYMAVAFMFNNNLKNTTLGSKG